ncbi:MAG: ORF6N domain-containing protein [Bacteroidia bacterium]
MTKKEVMIGIADDVIINKIFYIRGQKVMLDSDLAGLYGVETKRLKESVKRNILRFPDDFMFELIQSETEILRSQFATSRSEHGGTRYLPMVFTEQGVAMLSSVLNSNKAININIQIIRVFTRVRQMLLDNTEVRFAIEKLEKKTDNNTKNIELVFQYFDELVEKKENPLPRKKVGFKIPKKKK